MCAACEGQLGHIIRHQRFEAGLSQRDLADAAGVSIGVIRDLEQGLTSRPRAVTLYRLASVIGLDTLPSGSALAMSAQGPQRRPPAADSGAVQVQILGPVTVLRDGIKIVLSQSRMRLVLALLAANLGEVVSRGQISDALWRDTPPRNAPVMIQSYVSGLRRILDAQHPAHSPDGLIISVGSGYRLNTGDCRLDLSSFRRHVEQARAARAAGDLEACCRAFECGLGLWRGDPLCDIEALCHHPVVVGLARQRDRAVIEFAEAAAQIGWHDGPLPHLEQLTEQAPYNERAFAHYMIALAGTGRPAEALEAFEQIRRQLVADLGLSPGPELRAAHAQVLRQQVPAASRVSLGGHFPVCQLPAAAPDFTARLDEQARLVHLLSQPCEPAGRRVAVLSGMPGVGKTALALHVAHKLSEDFPDGQIWTQLTDSAGCPRDPAEVLAELLTTLGVSASAVPKSAEERAALYRSRLARLRVLIVADDACSHRQVRPLLPGSGDSAVLITTQSETAAIEGSRLCQLRPLTTAQLGEFLGQIIGTDRIEAEPEAGQRLSEACYGLPLAARIIGMKLAARKSWRLAALARQLTERQVLASLTFGELSVSGRIARVYANLDDLTQHVFRRLPLLGHEFSESAMAAAIWEPHVTTGTQDIAAIAANLADKSFLLPLGTDAAGSPRYRLHRLLRDFAAHAGRPA
jgi:DNA-binding SARP family transcriptional activator